MISSLYGANIVQYNPATKLPVKNDTKEESKGKGFFQAVHTQTQEEQGLSVVKQQAPEQPALTPKEFNAEEESSGLISVQEHLGKPIPIKNILEDFQSTLNALGADDAVRNEVKTYLGVVTLQAQQSQPHTIFIKQALRSAAGRMDEFITQALGEKSQVVKDWVDALLMQPIDFKGDATLTEVFGSVVSAPQTNHVQAQQPEVAVFSDAQKKELKQLIQSVQQALSNDDIESANASYQQALELTNGYPLDEVRGKLHQRMARYAENNRQYQDALAYYDAAYTSFEVAGQTDKKGLVLFGAARVLDDSGRREAALSSYQEALNLLSETPSHPALASLHNDYGNLLFVDAQYDEALAQFSSGITLAKENGQTSALVSLLSNQGAVYRRLKSFDKAEQSYKEAIQLARTDRDKDAYVQGLNALAATYLESNRPQPALKIMEKLRRL